MLKKLSIAHKNKNTYNIGLLQSKAYRILQQTTTKHLVKLGIGPVRWSILGLLSEKEGIKPSIIARELGVEAPFITEMAKKLQKIQLISIETDTSDNRSKTIKLTQKGKRFVLDTERHLREKMKPLIKNVSPKDFIDYLFVLSNIIANHDQMKKEK